MLLRLLDNNRAMNISPKIVKRPDRLSLSKRAKGAESPTTPGRLIGSPNTFNTPPSIRFAGTIQSPSSYSTPLNHYKRSCPAEESPSQDYDSDPQPLLCTQEAPHHIVDVEWNWEGQRPKLKAKPLVHNKPRRVDVIKQNRPQRQPKKAILRKSPECDKKKGFYKFREELLKDLVQARENPAAEREVSPLTDVDADELESSFKENDDTIPSKAFEVIKNIEVIPVAKRVHATHEVQNAVPKPTAKNLQEHHQKLQTRHSFSSSPQVAKNCEKGVKHQEKTIQIPQSSNARNPSTSKESKESNLLEDSDLDNLLLQCSQQVEASYHDQSKRIKIDQKVDHFVNDSFDDFILSVDVDAKLIEKPKPKLCGSPLIRHNSMPAKSPFSKKVPARPMFNLIRHNSMPSNEQQQEAEQKKTLGGTNCSKSSAESIAAEKRRCTAAEIERKRQEAIQRREASKLRKMSGYY